MNVWTLGRRLTMVAAIAFAVPLAAQGTITGKVTDSLTSAPLYGATVTALATTGSGFGSAMTAEDGTYRITNLPNGTYTVTAKHIGHAQMSVADIRVSGGSVTVNMLLAKATMFTETVVTETRGASAQKALDAPASVHVVDTKEITERPSLTVADHLQQTPGIQMSRGGIVQSNIVARGFNNIFSGSMLMLQDYRFAGVPSLRVNVPFLFTGSNEDIDHIEVLLGPASALYGPNSGAGVLHVITKSPFTSQGTTVTLDGGTQSIMRVSARHASVIGDRLGFKVSGEYTHGKDFEYHDPAEPDTFPASAPVGRAGKPNVRDFTVERYTGEARMDYRLDARTEAVTTVGMTKDVSGIELTGANGAALAKNWSYINLQQRFRRGRFFAQAFANLSDAGNDTSTSLTGTYLLRSGQPIVDKSRVWVGQVQHGFDIAKSTFTYGVDYIYTDPRTGHTINGNNEDIDNTKEYGAYIQGTVPLRPKWDFVGAARLDKHNLISGTQFSPRAALVYKPTAEQNWRLTYNRSFSTPANFTYFLDLIQAANVDGAGLNVRAVGNHGTDQFDRTCTGAAFGSFCMRSQYNNAALTPASASAAYAGLINNRAAAIQAGVQASLAANPATAANAAALAAAVVQGLKAGTPTNTDLATHVAYLLNPASVLSPDQVQDVPALKPGYTNTFELGYKGNFGKSARLSVDLWYQIRGDVNPPAGIATPSVFSDSASYRNYFNGNITNSLTQVFLSLGMPQAQAAGTAAAVAAQISPVLAGQLKAAPLGTVTFADQKRSDVAYTYYSVSDSTVKVAGVDIGYDWLLTDRWTVTGTYSWQDKNVFNSITYSTLQGGNGKPFMSNSPKNSGSLALTYGDEVRGYGFEVRGRYTDAFPVNSGVYVSDQTLAGPHGAYMYPSVPTTVTLDLGFNYRLPVARRNIMWSINGTNVLDDKKATFAGTAPIGALWMTRLSYTF